jgi:hypothetical protein
MALNQRGFDLESRNAEGALVRRIEVKGRSGPWANGELVTMTRAEFTDAWNRADDGQAITQDFDYWLYVVVGNVTGAHFQLYTLRNPVARAGGFEFRAATWALEGILDEGPITIQLDGDEDDITMPF